MAADYFEAWSKHVESFFVPEKYLQALLPSLSDQFPTLYWTIYRSPHMLDILLENHDDFPLSYHPDCQHIHITFER
jgi:hypothetical protein